MINKMTEIKKNILILDTDIGGDIDDHWALAMMLCQKNMQPDLIMTASGNTRYRAALTRHFLKQSGFEHIPVAAGIFRKDQNIPENLWQILPVGTVDPEEKTDAVEKAIQLIENAQSVTIIAIGALTNIAAIVEQRPDLLYKCRLIAMSGSRAMGAMDKPGKIPEFNVFSDIEAAKKVYAAKWQDFLLTPLDHCGALVMQGQDYQKVLNSSNPVARELIHTYLVWLKTIGSDNLEPASSSILFDTAAVRLAMPGGEDNCIIEPLSIRIADDGSWIETDEPANCRVASGWKNRSAHLADLADILSKGCCC